MTVKLFDHRGAPINMSNGTYEAVQKARRLKSWQPFTDQAINSLIQGGVETLRSRSRQIVRDNGYASNAEDIFCTRLVGTGIRPMSTIENDSLREEINELWKDWVDEADADGCCNFYGIQDVIAKAIFEAGEIFIRKRVRRNSDGLAVPLQLQMLEAEQLPLNEGDILTGNIQTRMGIELDAIGRRVAYNFFKKHPGDFTELKGQGERVRVPAQDVIHAFPVLRPGQLRGQPRFPSALVKLYLLDQYDDAELDRKKIAALFAGFITKLEPELMMMSGQIDDPNDPAAAVAPLEPGTMQVLFPGEDVKFSDPADVGGNYEAFQFRTLTQIASGMGIPYTDLTGDLSRVNYSSIRWGQINFRKIIQSIQHKVMVFQFCRVVWNWFIEQAVLSGQLSIPAGSGLTLKRLQRKVDWVLPKWDWVDPKKDREAEEIAVENGWQAPSDVIIAEGRDPEETFLRIARDKKRAEELGISISREEKRRSGKDSSGEQESNLNREDER